MSRNVENAYDQGFIHGINEARSQITIARKNCPLDFDNQKYSVFGYHDALDKLDLLLAQILEKENGVAI